MRLNYFALALLIVFLFGCDKNPSVKIKDPLWKMPTPYADGVFHTENIKIFAQDVNAATEGALTIEVHSGASLYRHPEIKQAVRTGQTQIGEVLMSLFGNEHPIFQIDTIPLLANSYEKAEKLWQASREVVEKFLDTQGLKLLFSVPWPPQGLYTQDEMRSIGDMTGLKIRAYNPMLSQLVTLMGGTPITVQTPEIPQAFIEKSINTMITSPSTGVSSEAWHYLNYYYDFQAWLPKNMVIVNKSIFEALPVEVQEAILKAAAEAEKRGWMMSERETVTKTQVLIENGIKIIEPSQEFWQDLIEIRRQMVIEWRVTAGEESKAVLKEYWRLINLP